MLKWLFRNKDPKVKILGLVSLWHIFETVELNRPELVDKLNDLTSRLETEFEEIKELINSCAVTGDEKDIDFIFSVLTRLPAPPATLKPLPADADFTWEKAENGLGPVGRVVNSIRVTVQGQRIGPYEKELQSLRRQLNELSRSSRASAALTRLQEEIARKEKEEQEELRQTDSEFRSHLSRLLKLYELYHHCLDVLSRVSSAAGVQAIVDRLDSGTPEERIFAYKALLRAGWQPKTTEQALNFCLARAKLGDTETECRQAEKELEKLVHSTTDVRELCELIEPRLAEEGLNNIQAQALYRLAEIEPPRAKERFAELLSNTSEPAELKIAAVKATGEKLLPVMPAEAVELLIRALDDLEMEVRVQAARALARLPESTPAEIKKAAQERLIFALRDGDLEVRDAAARALNEKTYPEAGARLAEFLLHETNPNGREFAAIALKLNFSATPQTTAALVTALRDPDAAVRKAAAEALTAQSAVPTEPEKRLEFFCAKQEWSALAAAGSAAVPCLLPRLRDLRADIRLEVVRVLGRIRAREAVKELCIALSDSDRDVRKAVARALAEIGDPDAIPALKTAISREGFQEVRAEMERAVRRLS